jgi:putative membrane protein
LPARQRCPEEEQEEQEHDDEMSPIHTQPPAGLARGCDQEIRNKFRSALLSGTDCCSRERSMKSTSLAILVLFLPTVAYPAENPSHAFLKKAIEGNHAEIQMGQLAQQKGQSDSVKKFGQILSDDHSAANQKAVQAAKSMDVPAPSGPAAKQKADHEKMSKLTGAQFDREFAIHMIADHEKDIAEYKKEAKRSDAAADYAKGQIDVLQKHLEIAKSLKRGEASSR